MKKSVLTILIALSIPTFLLAQEEQKPKKFENAEWYRVVYVKYHNGKKGEATNIIKEYYRPLVDKLGRDITTYETLSGEWDRITFFKLSEGISEFEWETSPQAIAWNKELLKHIGSEEKLKEIQAQFRSCTLETKVEIVRKMVW